MKLKLCHHFFIVFFFNLLTESLKINALFSFFLKIFNHLLSNCRHCKTKIYIWSLCKEIQNPSFGYLVSIKASGALPNIFYCTRSAIDISRSVVMFTVEAIGKNQWLTLYDYYHQKYIWTNCKEHRYDTYSTKCVLKKNCPLISTRSLISTAVNVT